METKQTSYFSKSLNAFDDETRKAVIDILDLATTSLSQDDFIKKASQHSSKAIYGAISGVKTLQINGAFVIFSAQDDAIIFKAVSIGPVYSDWPPPQQASPLQMV